MNALVDSITVARCGPGRRATKRIVATDEGALIEGYDAGRYIAVSSPPVAGLRDLARMLDGASRDPRAFILRGELLPGVGPRRCRRLLHAHREDDGTATPPTFREVPRRWVVVDFDDVPGPYRFDPRDGELAATYCRALLPEPWRRASFWWGLSSSAGFKPGVRIKLAFWLEHPATGAELDRQLKSCPIDPSTLRAVQPIYVARPILVGLEDPVQLRTGVEHDVDDEVRLPELPAQVLQRPAPAPPPAGTRWVSGATADGAERRLHGLCGVMERAGVGGRHRCLVWAAARAVELDDALPRAAIAAELIAAARRAGLEDSDADLARQIRNGFRLGIFGEEAAA